VRLKRRGISPLIATIILIAICVAGGLLIYNVFFSTTGTISAKGQLEVESIDLVRSTGGTTVFTITIKNAGNKPATTLSVKLEGQDSAFTVDLTGVGGALQPGQSISHVEEQVSGSYIVGNVYTVVIQATFSDGSTFSHTTSVQCRSG